MSPASPEGGPRVVVLRALGLGDLLVAVPALRAIARAFRSQRRVLVAPAALSPLVALLDRAVSDVTHADFRARVGTVPARAGRPVVAINLHGAGPDSHRALLATGAGDLVAFRHPDVAGARGPDWREDEHEMARWCRLLNAHGIPADASDWRLDLGRVRALPTWRRATVLHPGAASPARRWPVERWVQVARAASAAGHRILVSGSAAERPTALEIAARAGLDRDAVAAGRTGLGGLAHGLAQARVLVSGDTGIAHLATAVGLPSVLLFGPTSPARWGPPGEQDGRHVVLWAGRTGDPHGQRTDPGLLEIGPDDVLAAMI